MPSIKTITAVMFYCAISSTLTYHDEPHRAQTLDDCSDQSATRGQNSLNIMISQIEASAFIQDLTEIISIQSQFDINGTHYIVQKDISPTRGISPAEITIIENIGSTIAQATVNAIAQAIANNQSTSEHKPQLISLAAAVVLLQQFATTVAAGNNFAFNGINYIVQANELESNH